MPNNKNIFTSYQPIDNQFGRKDRYKYARVIYGNRSMFLKSGIAKDSPENLQRELIWADFMAHVVERYPGLDIRAPRDVELIDSNNLVMELIDSPLLATPKDSSAWVQKIDRFARVLVCLDNAASDYQIPDYLRGFKRRSIDQSLKYWLRDIELTDVMKRAVEYLDGSQSRLESRMQHGDLTAWQIFDNGSEWIIYDGERSGDDLPRYNDLAYSYGRLAIRCGELSPADQMIQLFVEYSKLDEAEFFADFRPVLILRTLGMVGDAIRDQLPIELDRANAILKQALDEYAT